MMRLYSSFLTELFLQQNFNYTFAPYDYLRTREQSFICSEILLWFSSLPVSFLFNIELYHKWYKAQNFKQVGESLLYVAKICGPYVMIWL